MSIAPRIKAKEISEIDVTDYQILLESSLINLKTKPSRPPLALSIGQDDKAYAGINYPLRFGTFGNISMIKGEEKARKSWLKSLLIASCFGGNSNLYAPDFKGHNLHDKWIFDIDTEQDEFDSWQASNRIPQLVGSIDKPIIPENYKPIKLREKSASERRGFLKWLVLESEFRNNIGLISIDGYVDLVDDFNNQRECIDFTQSLMTYSSKANCHITGILHLNPNSDKARGHLGTILQQKCETVVVIKDAGEYSEVYCHRGRGKKFMPFGSYYFPVTCGMQHMFVRHE